MANTKTKKSSGSSASTGAKRGGNTGQSTTNGRSSAKSNGSTKQKKESGEPQLQEFFLDAIKDIYWAEKHLTKALPKMQKAATSEELQKAIEDHTAQTEEHVARLEEVFQLLDKKPQAKKCEAMEGLTKEGESNIEETEDESQTRDVAIIASAQKIEHYEIATYGTLATLAQTMGYEEIAGIFNETLEEEKETDELLTEIAQSINLQAKEEEGEDNEEEEEESGDDNEEEDEESGEDEDGGK